MYAPLSIILYRVNVMPKIVNVFDLLLKKFYNL